MTPPRSDARFEVTPTAESHFSWLRTRMSIERTLMSWLRTATAMFGFGFAIVQFFDAYTHMKGVTAPRFPGAPRVMGLSLIAASILALSVAIWQYRSLVNYLWSSQFAAVRGIEGRKWSSLVIIAFVLLAIALFTLLSIFTRPAPS